ncbi:NUDIX hydrolase [Candidatus Venteria ishoeyi]|uniref:NUDIX hydrolase n=1 Tax=Candidatus Venteria ishoeyi TaxID=1899563 RepID=UPI0025A62264|nr:NUDIX hydrolase [Candidatus Venteria ishoeyi]MDM8547843.1 NUDIX hydrolase [Candidatus Venteria ishoeyi]
MNTYPHITVAAIIEADQHFLCVEECLNSGQHVLNQPAGHLEPGESLQQAVIREVKEETGWCFEPQFLIGIYQYTGQNGIAYVRFCFAGVHQDHDPSYQLDKDIVCTHWLNRSALMARQKHWRSPMVIRCIDDYLAGQRYPLDLICNIS